MPGQKTAIKSGTHLKKEVAALAESLGLTAVEEVKVGRRLWGAVRSIDVVISDPKTSKALGVECKAQAAGGSAEEKIPATIQDIGAWPIPGIVVFAGLGFSQNMRAYLYSTGRAVALEDLRSYLQLFFGLSIHGVGLTRQPFHVAGRLQSTVHAHRGFRPETVGRRPETRAAIRVNTIGLRLKSPRLRVRPTTTRSASMSA